ncbi:hypothetical protein ASF33_19000 [Methylobacterium sp. Leaf92]|nr:hypothetical protein ASF33_19000 [Methylobacterium sp. Leaf92]
MEAEPVFLAPDRNGRRQVRVVGVEGIFLAAVAIERRRARVRLGSGLRCRLRGCVGVRGVVTVLSPHRAMGYTAPIGRWPLVEVPLGGFHIHAAGAVENK